MLATRPKSVYSANGDSVFSHAPRVCVTGAGGFIGSHLVTYLKIAGCWVRGVDIKYPEFAASEADEFEILDLRRWESCLQATRDVQDVYALAADMGGMGFISLNDAAMLHKNPLIDVHTLEAARANGVTRCLYSSSACVYPEYKQLATNVVPVKEADAYPAQPQSAYGWEKLTGEKLCMYYSKEYGLQTRIVRLHNIFGPLGTWDGGREKAPAALCRKIARAKLTNDPIVEIWGDGEQTRSFSYIDDCTAGLVRLMRSTFSWPVNLGHDPWLTINHLADTIASISC